MELFSCGQRTVENDIIGHWEASETSITIRDKVDGEFSFTHGPGTASLIVSDQKTASGTIGNASFSNAKIVPNRGFPVEMTGIKYIIKCDLNGKIFPSAPVEYKDVEFWVIYPLQKDSMRAELRYTKGMAHFPMTEFEFIRKSE